MFGGEVKMVDRLVDGSLKIWSRSIFQFAVLKEVSPELICTVTLDPGSLGVGRSIVYAPDPTSKSISLRIAESSNCVPTVSAVNAVSTSASLPDSTVAGILADSVSIVTVAVAEDGVLADSVSIVTVAVAEDGVLAESVSIATVAVAEDGV